MKKNKNKNKDESQKFEKDLKQVQDQYLDYPYPMRNPEEEMERLITLQGDCLVEINHYLFNGRQDFNKNFRILVAGGGTGDAAIYYAEQLRGTNGQVVYLDFSKNSMNIAKERAKIRKLTNIKWYNDSILNLPKMDVGKFDLINCVGVLHHLASPDEGLKALKSVLKPEGGMALMVYAKYGRTGLYHVQNIMQLVNEGETNRQKEVDNGWEIVKALPPTNWFKLQEHLLNDHLHIGDVGLYDMFLHKQDRAYSVPEVYEFVDKAGLHFVDFTDPFARGTLDIRSFLQPGELLDKILKMDKVQQQTICEIMAGNIIKHSFWVTNRSDVTVASFDEMENIPYFYGGHNYAQETFNFLEKNPSHTGQPIAFDINVFNRPMNLTIATSELTKHMFDALKTQTKTLGEIYAFVSEKVGKKLELAEFKKEMNNVFVPFSLAGCLFLRHKSVNFRMI